MSLDSEFEDKFYIWTMTCSSIERRNMVAFDCACRLDSAKLCNVCAYPIDADNFRLVQHGDVCRVCYDLWHAVSERQWFVSSQREFNEASKPKDNWL